MCFPIRLTQRDKDTEDSKPLKLSGGEIKFNNVSFAYNEEKTILKGLNFTVPAGKKVAIVGSSGGGCVHIFAKKWSQTDRQHVTWTLTHARRKSTVLRLVYRFFDPQSGSITIDGQDLRKITVESLRKNVGVVPQDLVLFNDTIGFVAVCLSTAEWKEILTFFSYRYNIKYGRKNCTDEEMHQVAKFANIHEQILQMPDGYDTLVGERGLKLSGT